MEYSSHINRSKKILVIKIKDITETTYRNLLKIEAIGDWKVKCRAPENNDKCRGLIGPIELDTKEEELMEYLKSPAKIVKVTRLTKGKDKTPTLSMIITFQIAKLPEHVTLFGQQFRVSMFIDKPWQCFNCQRFGHNAQDCKSKSRCVACAGPHTITNCPTKNKPTPDSAKCANCDGKHPANYGGCLHMKTAKKIENFRTRNKMSYLEAAKMVKNMEKDKEILTQTQETNAQPLQTNRRNVSNNETSTKITCNYLHVATQTEELQLRTNKENNPDTESTHNQQISQPMISMITEIIVKMLKIYLPVSKEDLNIQARKAIQEVTEQKNKINNPPPPNTQQNMKNTKLLTTPTSRQNNIKSSGKYSLRNQQKPMNTGKQTKNKNDQNGPK